MQDKQRFTRAKILVTGGCGFIGSNFIRYLFERGCSQVANLDLLTYAGNQASLQDIETQRGYCFHRGDIRDGDLVNRVLTAFQPDYVVNFAAESHVDRSIDGPGTFIQTNILGTYNLLEQALRYWNTLSGPKQQQFRFLHVSTDEVYGSLGETGLFSENTAYDPHSPYSASKAASDHLVSAWHHTYGLPTLITNCSNNYGPYQFPEKLIPLMILNAISGKPLPIYGTGKNVRDWLYVRDHCSAIEAVLAKGEIGETYNIGGGNERSNLEVVEAICTSLSELLPDSPQRPFTQLKTFVQDRPAHDWRYAIDASKLRAHTQWQPAETFESGLKKTIQWYLDNDAWTGTLRATTAYNQQRLGLERKAIG